MIRLAPLFFLLASAAAAQPVSSVGMQSIREAVHEATDAVGIPTEVADALAAAATAVFGEEAKFTASDATSSSRFGFSVSLDGDRALVGAYLADTAAEAHAGSAYVFVRSGTMWSEEAKLIASDPQGDDVAGNFGYSVSLDGDRALIGARNDDTAAGIDAGSAYVFVRSGTAWSEEARLTASDAARSDFFGISVALDGDLALVGAPFDDTDAGSGAGSAYVFVFDGAQWSEEAKLTASDAAAGDRFGISVSLDGTRALVGSYLDDASTAATDAGSAYVFERSGAMWSETTKLTASDAAGGDRFGISVSLDGDRALVGASLDSFNADVNAGSAYVFARSGLTWNEEAKLTASDAEGGDFFGTSVSLSGECALVGAWNDGTDTDSGIGSAYVFERLGATWSEMEKLTASDAEGSDFFGISVSLSEDRAFIGAYFDNAPPAVSEAGSAYVFAQTAVEVEGAPTVSRLRIDDAFPNPVQRYATVRYILDEAAEVHLALYDVLGREVMLLAVGARAAGSHDVRLAAMELRAGMYVLRLTVGPDRATRKMLVVR